MLYYIHVEKKITQEQIIEAFFQLLKVKKNEILFFDGFFPDRTEVYHKFLVQLTERPAGFLISLELYTEFFTSEEGFYNFLEKISQYLSSRIFIDETDKTGALFMPNQEPREASFDIGVENDEDYLYIIE